MAVLADPATEAFASRWAALQGRYEKLLEARLGLSAPIDEVARFALAGGKRLRPLLVELVGEAVGAPAEALGEAGVAIEYLHTASILVDDLPCMDDAQGRRGRPAAHVQFSEADAVLTAFALVARSTGVLLEAPVSEGRRHEMVALASKTVAATMATGQARELRTRTPGAASDIRDIHQRKTASLFTLAGRLAVACAPASASGELADRVVTFTTLVGRAYQIADDIEDSGEAGEARGNLARAVGVDSARQEARTLLQAARESIESASPLVEFADWLERQLAAFEASQTR